MEQLNFTDAQEATGCVLGSAGRQRVAASLLVSQAGLCGERPWLGKAILNPSAKQPLNSVGFLAKQMDRDCAKKKADTEQALRPLLL